MYRPPIVDYEFLLRNVPDGQETLDQVRGGDLSLDDSVPCLMQLGIVAGGWMRARLITAALAKPNATGAALAETRWAFPAPTFDRPQRARGVKADHRRDPGRRSCRGTGQTEP